MFELLSLFLVRCQSSSYKERGGDFRSARVNNLPCSLPSISVSCWNKGSSSLRLKSGHYRISQTDFLPFLCGEMSRTLLNEQIRQMERKFQSWRDSSVPSLGFIRSPCKRPVFSLHAALIAVGVFVLFMLLLCIVRTPHTFVLCLMGIPCKIRSWQH